MDQSLAAFSSIQKPQATQKNLPLKYVFRFFLLRRFVRKFEQFSRMSKAQRVQHLVRVVSHFASLTAALLHMSGEQEKTDIQ